MYKNNPLHFRFPGLKAKDDVASVLGLLLSYDPSNTIKAKVSLAGGFQLVDCKSVDVESKSCPEGFVIDTENNYCYMALGK